MGCVCTKHRVKYEDPTILAAQTCFKEAEVQALHELFRKLSTSLDDDNYISKEEFQFGLFRNRNEQSLLANRMFQLFDSNSDEFIGYGEFVRSLSIFHPDAPRSQKVAFAFQLYDTRKIGYIEPEEVKEMIVTFLNESNLLLSDEIIDAIVDKTFKDADSKGDGKIDLEEWNEFVARNPTLIKYMTIPYLKDITTAFPSFVLRIDTKDEFTTSSFETIGLKHD